MSHGGHVEGRPVPGAPCEGFLGRAAEEVEGLGDLAAQYHPARPEGTRRLGEAFA